MPKYAKKSSSERKAEMNDFLERLEKGVTDITSSGQWTDYLDFVGKFRKYSIRNTLAIYLQRPEATLVAGFRQWEKTFNRHIKKGEKAIAILAPCIGKVTLQDEDGNDVEKKYTYFKRVPVFDISQTEGDYLPENPATVTILTASDSAYKSLISSLIKTCPVEVRYADDTELNGANGSYNRVERVIRIRNGMPEAQTIKTLAHEQGHEILHSDSEDAMNITRDVKEVEAESVAYLVCNHYGINADDYSFGYVAGWAGAVGAKAITESASRILKAANEIIDRVDKHIRDTVAEEVA